MQGRDDSAKQLSDARTWHDNFFEEEAAWVRQLDAGVQPEPAQVKRKKKASLTDLPAEEVDSTFDKAKGLPFKTPLVYASGWPSTRTNYAHLLQPSVRHDLQVIQDALDAPPSWETPPQDLILALKATEGAEDFLNMWKSLPALESEVRALRIIHPAEERRSVFVRHADDEPIQDQHYNPRFDAAREHIAIAQVDEADSTHGRGWELIRIDTDMHTLCGIDVVNVTYLWPKSISTDAVAWPKNWPNYLMAPMYTKVNGRRSEWKEENFPVEAIVWSTEQKRNGESLRVELRIPVALQKYALLAAVRCEQPQGTGVYLPAPQLGQGMDGDE
jgi:hypothetical protein